MRLTVRLIVHDQSSRSDITVVCPHGFLPLPTLADLLVHWFQQDVALQPLLVFVQLVVEDW
jgi:hypothetical protein